MKEGPSGSAIRCWGHAKLETRVATNTIREVMSPLDRLTPLMPKKNKPKDELPA